MLKYETPSGTGEVENCWGDLSPRQFIATVALTNQFLSGGFDLDEYRLRLLEALTGYKRSKRKKLGVPKQVRDDGRDVADQINENLYLISEQLTFAVTPKCGPEEVLEFFSPELRELLKTRFPWEIYEPEMVSQLLMMKGRLRIEYNLNFNLGSNLVPDAQKASVLFKGPLFTATEGDIDTDLKAGQYLDAQEYFTAYSETRKEKYLDLMIERLYRPAGVLKQVQDDAKQVQDDGLPDLADKATKEAILMVFLYIQNTLVNDPVFSILFKRNEDTSIAPKISLGSDEAIGQLVEAGYGTHESILNLDIRTFFNYQIMMIKKNVGMLRSAGKKPAEIARELNLPVEIIQKL
ncbi:MAG TPA: hypothetical protein VFG54_12175 [Prolixibacteraceae bacterium]|nr:hypothetical protein [Prolixibacteraceae bacterium]